MANQCTASLAVWDAPSPVSAGENFAVKIGAKAMDVRSLAGARVEVRGRNGVAVQAALGASPLKGSEALYWAELKVPAPTATGLADYTVRLIADGIVPTPTRFTVAVTEKPAHRLRISVAENRSAEALAGVEIRLGPFHARTGSDGRAELMVCPGEYQLQLWRAAHIAKPQMVTIDGDKALDLTMTFVPEEHPDARWVR